MSLSSTPFLATLTIKMYAHIVGGTRIRGSKLEGNSFELTTSHFLRLLKESKLPDALSPLIEEVTQLQDLLYRIRQKENIVDEITQKAKELSNNHSLLLPGHWIFSSGKGHVIIYELIKEDGQCFTLHIINSARSEYFPRVQRNKKIYQAFLTYRHIPQEVLFDSNCISLLIQLWCNAIDNPNFPVEKVLFSASLQPLFSYIDNEEISSNRGYWIPVQKVSTCTWDVWMAYLKIRCVRSGLGEEAYGDLRLEFKTDTMLKEHEYCKNCDSSQRLYLLEMGNKHLAYSASKLEKRGRVECDQDIYNTCTKLVRELYVDIVKEKQALKKEPCIENVLLCSRDFMRMPQETSFDLSTENIEKTSPLPLLSDEMITGENAQRISSELLSYMESGKNKKQNLFRYLVERFAYHISLDAECWNNPTSCKNIFSIAFRYAHFLENGAQSISLRQINTMLALYLIAWHMIPYCPIQEGYCKDPNAFLRLIQRLDPSPSLIEATYTNPLLAPFDLREQKRLDELREHFLQKTHHNGIDLFQKILTQKVIENVEQDVELDFYRQSKELILDPERHYYMFIDGEKTEVKTEEEQIAFLAVRSGAWEIFPWIPYLREIHYSLAFLQCLIKSPVGRVVQRTDNKLIIKTLSQQKQTELVDKYTYQYGYKRIPPFLRKALNYQLYAQKDRETLLEEEDILLKHIAFLVRKKGFAYWALLLDFFIKNPCHLQRPECRCFLIMQLFNLSLGQPLHPDILDKICAFAKRVYANASDQDIELVLFAIFIVQQSRYLFPEHKQKLAHLSTKHKIWINERIENFDWEGGDLNVLRLLHLHRLNGHIPPDDLKNNPKDLQEILCSYFVVATQKSFKENHYLFLEEKVCSFISTLLPLSGNPNIRQITQSIIEETGVQNIPIESDPLLKQNATQIHYFTKEGKNVTLDLYTGTIFYDQNLLCHYIEFSSSCHTYQILFGDQSYPVVERQSRLYLDHPGGTFQMKPVIKQNKQDFDIAFCPKGEEKWYVFHEVDRLFPLVKNPLSSLFVDCLPFYDPVTGDWIFLSEKDYQHFHQAPRYYAQSKTIKSGEVTYEGVTNSALTRIEREDWILRKKYKQEKHIMLFHFEITFIEDAMTDALQWDHDRRFVVIDPEHCNPMKKIQTILLLHNSTTGEKRVIIPHCPISSSSSLFQGLLEISDKEKDQSWHDVKKNKVPYNVYEMFFENDKAILVPTTLEGTSALAYYWTYEERFEEALSLLHRLSREDILSEESKTPLLWLSQYAMSKIHCPTEALALSLHASLLFYTYPDYALDLEALNTTYTKYLASQGEVPINLRLTARHKEQLAKILPHFSPECFSYDTEARTRFSFRTIEPCTIDPQSDPASVCHSLHELYKKNLPSRLPIFWKPFQRQDFFICYETIYQDKTYYAMEAYLLIKHAQINKKPNATLDTLLLLFICLQGKKDGKILPPLPSLQDIDKESIKQFGAELYAFLQQDGSTYTPSAMPKLYFAPSHLFTEKLKTERQKMLCDTSPLNRENLFKKIRLQFLSPTPFIKPISLIQLFDNQEHTIQDKELELLQQALNRGRELLKEEYAKQEMEQRLCENEFLEQIQAFLVELSISQEKIMAQHMDELSTPKELCYIALQRIAGIYPDFSNIEQVEKLVLLQKLSKARNDREKQFVDRTIHLFISYEECAIDLMLIKKVLPIIEQTIQERDPIRRASYIKQIVATLLRDPYQVVQSLPLSYLEKLIFTRRFISSEGKSPLQNILEPLVFAKAFLASKGDKLPVVLVESRHYRAIREELAKAPQQTPLGQEIYAMDLECCELTEEQKLIRIRNKLQRVWTTKGILVMRSDIVQMCDLMLQKSFIENTSIDSCHHSFHTALSIFHIFQEKCVICTHTLPSSHVVLPLGSPISLPPQYVALIREIIFYITTEEEIKNQIDILQDRLPVNSQLWEKIKRTLAKKIATNPLFKNSSNEDQVKFVDFICQNLTSKQIQNTERGKCILFARHIICHCLPNCLKKHSKTYRDKMACQELIVPYVDLDGLCTDPYEIVCTHMVEAVQKGVTDLCEEGLKKQDACSQVPQRLTEEPEEQQSIVQMINQILYIAEQDISRILFYHKQYLHSSPQMLHKIIPVEILEPFVHYYTSEEKALYTLIKNNAQIYPLKEASIEELLKQSTRGEESIPDIILDIGNLFTEDTNATNAEKYLTFVHDKGKRAVLFFSLDEGLAIGRLIDENFIITSLEEPLLQFLEKENLSLEECIIFYDRYHDDMEIPLASISRGIMTYDEDMRLEDVLKPARSFSSFFCNFDFAFLQCGSFYTEQQAIASEEIVYRLLINQLQDKEESLRNFTEQGLKAFYDERYRKNVKNEADFKSIQNLCEPFIKTNL